MALEPVVTVGSVSQWVPVVSEGRMCVAKFVVSEGGPSATLTGQEGKYLIFQASILAKELA